MAGMTTTGVTVLSDYNDRAVIIEVTGVCRQDVIKTSNYQVKVPYSQFTKEMENINRLGGKISSVTVVGAGSSTNAAETESHGDEHHGE